MQQLTEAVGFERAYELLGHRLDPTYSMPKMMWLREHDPGAWSTATGALLAKDYITLRLTGRRVKDPSQPSGTLPNDKAQPSRSRHIIYAAEKDDAQQQDNVTTYTLPGSVGVDEEADTEMRSGTPELDCGRH